MTCNFTCACQCWHIWNIPYVFCSQFWIWAPTPQILAPQTWTRPPPPMYCQAPLQALQVFPSLNNHHIWYSYIRSDIFDPWVSRLHTINRISLILAAHCQHTNVHVMSVSSSIRALSHKIWFSGESGQEWKKQQALVMEQICSSGPLYSSCAETQVRFVH